MNSKSEMRNRNSYYIDRANAIGSGNDYTGSDFLTRWYERNIKMFTNVDRLSNNNDRILILVGAGHMTLLQHLFESSSRYQVLPSVELLAQGRNSDVPNTGLNSDGPVDANVDVISRER